MSSSSAQSSFRQGQADAMKFMQQPTLLASLPLALFNNAGMRGMVLRRLLLALGKTGAALARLAAFAAWQSFTSDYFYWRGVQQGCDADVWQRLTHAPLMLMYHAVGQAGEATDRYILPVQKFAEQMAWLRRKGFNVMRLDDLLSCWREGRLPPARSVVITFDDGYRDNHELAWPILQQHGFNATIFLVSGFIGTTNQWDKAGALAGRPLLNVQELQAMQAQGITFGGHSRTHRPLAGLPLQDLENEVAGCKHDLEQLLQTPLTSFAFPHGRYDAAAQHATSSAGYAAACCSEPGVNDFAYAQTHPWALRRLEVRDTVGLTDFALMLAAGKNRVVSRLIRSEHRPQQMRQ